MDLDGRYAEELHGLPAGASGTEIVYELLRSKGAPETCYVLGGGELDGREVGLRDALDQIVGIGGAMISCIEGRLGYLEGDEVGRYLLERPAQEQTR